jgi:hypothetical protein
MKMTTATREIENENAAKNARIFELLMEQFWKNWAPDDRYEAARFSSELHALVRQIYRDAQEPAFKQLEIIMRAMPSPLMGSARDIR